MVTAQRDFLQDLRSLPLESQLRILKIRKARRSSSEFCEYCFVTPTGEPWIQQDFHKEWHDALDKYAKVQIEAFREASKTEQISIGYALWRLGNDPNLRVKVVSADDELSKAIIGAAGEHIESNPKVREVFPKLKPTDRGSWNAQRLFVQRERIMKDASLEAHGVLASGVGGRCDLLIFDDICNFRNTIQQPVLKAMIAKAVENVWMRLVTPGGQIIWLDTPWDVDDTSAVVNQWSDFYHISHPVYKKVRNKITGEIREVPRWPAKHSVEYLQNEEKRRPFAFKTQMRLLRIRSGGTPFFTDGVIENAKIDNKGDFPDFIIPGLGDPMPGHIYVTFWDLGRHVNKRGRNATVGITLDITSFPAYIRNVQTYIDIPYLSAPGDENTFTVAQEIERIARLYPGETIIESNHAGETVIDALDIVATPWTTTVANKQPMIHNLLNALSNDEIKWTIDERLDEMEEQLRNYTIMDDHLAQDWVISLSGACMFIGTEGGSGLVI